MFYINNSNNINYYPDDFNNNEEAINAITNSILLAAHETF